jgi:hypothetical protein
MNSRTSFLIRGGLEAGVRPYGHIFANSLRLTVLGVWEREVAYGLRGRMGALRSFPFLALLFGVLASTGSAAASAPPARTFTVTQAQRAFRRETGLELVRFRAASTPEVASLRTKPYETLQFGNFQLFVLKPDRVKRMRRVFTNGVPPNKRGIYWVPDRAGGWIAVTLFDRNLVLAWFPRYPSRQIDARWERLSRRLRALAPESHHT